MSIYRSEEMVRLQLYLQLDAAYATVSELGELGLVQFKDFNANVNAFQRKFVHEIRRCDEMERKLRYVEKEISTDKIPLFEAGDNPRAPYPREIIDLEATFERLESELREVNNNTDALKKNFTELTELREVLSRAQDFFQQREAKLHSMMDDTTPLETSDHLSVPAGLQLGFVAGVIRRDRLMAFERILWFACRGNVFLRTDDREIVITDNHSGDEIQKVVFIIFFQGEQLKTRVRKICDGYRATLYPVSADERERTEMLTGVTTRIAELVHVLQQTESHRDRVLRAAAKELHNWILKVRKIKAIFHTMNECNFDMSRNSLIAEIWCPKKALDQVNHCLIMGAEVSGSSVPPIMHSIHTTESPPTYFANNKLTSGFQSIINAYGIANYREINPALYTVITFPFLFAVMFGDAGHGLLMFLFALSLVLLEKKIAAQRDIGEVATMFFGGRYIILLMGAFSVYTGLIYNDIFSKSCNIFGTAFHSNYSDSVLDGGVMYQMDPASMYRGDPYPFGMDPIWQVSDASTKITYLNSLKMKMSIILGVSQMVFGLFLNLMNKIYFRDIAGIVCEFIPELLFLLSIFGYLAIILIYKWLAFTSVDSKRAPSLLIQLINMFMFKYSTDVTKTPLPQQPFYSGQQSIQSFLVALALICVPWLLLTKPIYLLVTRRTKPSRFERLEEYTDTNIMTDDQTASETELDMVLQPIVDEIVLENGEGDETATQEDVPATVTVSQDEFDVNLQPIVDQIVVENNETTESATQQETTAETVTASTDPDEFSFGDIMMTQVIHTIDFCLSCVSHTASYLRLWALSLAHSELSDVFWTMVFRRGLAINGYASCAVIVLVWLVWAGITIGVLLLMEGLSAFLHALRLHWVEFQTKFYGGEGYPFIPFTFKHVHEMVHEETTK